MVFYFLTKRKTCSRGYKFRSYVQLGALAKIVKFTTIMLYWTNFVPNNVTIKFLNFLKLYPLLPMFLDQFMFVTCSFIILNCSELHHGAKYKFEGVKFKVAFKSKTLIPYNQAIDWQGNKAKLVSISNLLYRLPNSMTDHNWS